MTLSPSGEALQKAPPLPLSFFKRPAPLVARELLGKVLVVARAGEVVALRLVEVEAYLGAEDPASHAHRGPTPRNQIMFSSGGTCYVYLSYGMHHCVNVVTGESGRGEAVLLRAGEPLFGIETMTARRGLSGQPPGRVLKLLASGPGRLAQALAIDRADYGRLFDHPEFKIINDLHPPHRYHIQATPRIGISKAKDLPLRFLIAESRQVSGPRQRGSTWTA